jgi:hypothetical protein
MRERKSGQTSAAEQESLKVIKGGMFGARPEPLDDLNAAQAAIWRKIVDTESGEFFTTAATRSMLGDLCRHREAADKLSAVIDSFQLEWLKVGEGAKRYAALLKMRDLEIRAAASLATKLRLTNQARYVPTSAGRAARDAIKGTKPWEM